MGMIHVTAKSRYAVSALMHLAIHNTAGAVPLSEVSVCQGISLSYVDQIFTRLRRAGLVRGTPGPGGGYRLGRPPERIAIGEVITLMDADQRATQGSGSPLDQAVWDGLTSDIEGFLDSLTLAHFVQGPRVRESLEAQYAGSRWRCDVCGALSDRQPKTGSDNA